MVKLIRTIIGQFLAGNKDSTIKKKLKKWPKNYEHAQLLNAYNFCLS